MADNNEVVNIDKMIEKFKTQTELKTYCGVQFKTITNLTKKLKEKEEEVEHLKGLLEKNVQLMTVDASNVLVNSTDEEQICRTQLRRLRDLSMARELTLEESKKAEIFVKLLLNQITVKDEDDNKNIKNMSTAELIQLVDDGK